MALSLQKSDDDLRSADDRIRVVVIGVRVLLVLSVLRFILTLVSK